MLTSYTNRIDAALQQCLDEFTYPGSLYDPVHYLFVGGGKRVRPILTLLACEAAGGNSDHAMSAALSVELLHNFTLVHDDIMDRSPMRRGRPTVHKAFDENTAILSGDVMMGMAMRMLERSARHAPDPIAVIGAFSTGLIEVCEGQALDMAFMTRSDVRADEYFHMIEQKTAKLLEMSVNIGALIAGAPSDQVEALRVFAREIGLAFQLQDDLLDLFGSEKFGKAPGGDLVEGKRTWLVLTARDRANSATSSACAGIMHDFFANNGIPRERVSEMVDCMTQLGVIDEAEALIRTTTEDAYAHLHHLPDTAARGLLEFLAKQLMERKH